jgi:hypothetical protein
MPTRSLDKKPGKETRGQETRGQTGRSPILFAPVWESEYPTRAEPDNPLSADSILSDIFLGMARLPRVVAVDVAHHVTQRGNARQVILASD